MIKIFAFPGAGSSAITYYRWMRHLPESFLISPLDLPGRGMKIKEEKIHNNRDLIDYFYSEVCKKLEGTEDDYVLIGNSFSSILAIQLCNKIEKEAAIKMPRHLFLSVEVPPCVLKTRKKMSEDIERKDFVRGVINRFFEDSMTLQKEKELIVGWILDKLYSDKEGFLKLSVEDVCRELFNRRPDEEKDLVELVGFIIEHLHLFLEDEEIINSLPEDSLKIATDMTVFGAKTDQVASEEDMGLWREYTSANFDLRMLDGEHTILYDNPEVIICEMKEVLNKGYEQ